MPKICYNTRDELVVVDLDQTAYIQAVGNYSLVVFITGQKMTVTAGISKIELMIARAYGKGVKSDFVRLGRSVIINQRYLLKIDVLKQALILGDTRHPNLPLRIPKSLVRGYKDVVEQQFARAHHRVENAQ